MENTQIKTGPKDVFLHLLAIIALYVSAGSFIALLFQYINVYLPDKAVDQYYSLQSAYASMRWSIALLFVIYPVYVWASWFLNKEYKMEQQKREIKIRKWLLYFTLFATALLIIGDLVALIYSFLQGELTARFLYKILAVFLVAAIIFKYYLMDLKNSVPYKIFAYAVSALVALAVIGGFFVAGSPQEARLRQFDDMRVRNLQEIQSQVVYYWQYKENKLPIFLDDLKNDIDAFIPPKDPETGQSYEYKVTGASSFTLCANFALPSLPDQTSRYAPMPAKPYGIDSGIAQNWEHLAGHICFDRTIDPDFYKLPEKTR
ncbi:hypothetical protein A2W54_03030 [Candidatus Giovannonibacteria bacterium RIFCSPHIGHO2_02_43_13]|uniref:DUF5671 domain-containing protein n=1 Tax=Candidatus Giovannonibacteria bacterium RIFCSPHIGHO2_02_43_13 TaxID=1798330 RepID=A0A1F5WSY2_9BACT|nr:MAG: hypothetical protein UW28_C0027G0003 [Parcubacteria group bacterium GW2011_GWA2_44_13]OGF74745.1 MAG: hypothetical protein A3E06_01830 [Candidatus Giovannonibacteria bacterium RIFCSPHIGHO2_12_FULL_44_42]OGF78740.1 MAG: hypothetical protein A2W54_03030 [Candidatus Giovannonibacteria bacterium RIFCSPHIGHO2_02_43_13]OGF97169.1 MAG: hypothetical protein A3H08_00255 [Candidatus Giovannonibacteria bacterium RIFCSPLOWO2_12_FULL_44_32]